MLIMIYNLLQDHEMLYFIQHVQIYIIIIMLSTLHIKGRNFIIEKARIRLHVGLLLICLSYTI